MPGPALAMQGLRTYRVATMDRRLGFLVLLAGWAAGGCAGGGRSEPVVVLRTEDFIADPATMPTTVAPSPTVPVRSASVSPVEEANVPTRPVSQEPLTINDVSVESGVPRVQPGVEARASESPVLVDAKIGEINGRPIRVDDLLRDIGPRLAAIALTKMMAPEEWRAIGLEPQEGRIVTRGNWLDLAEVLFRGELSRILKDELLAAEARAALKPQQRAGLRNFVRESTAVQRRSLGGSQAELERQLRVNNQNEHRFGREVEARVLISMQLEEKVKKRSRASWKDVKRYYDRNIEAFQPPATATFRIISCRADNADAVAAIRESLAAGKPFAEVASLPANQYNAEGGGLFGDGKTVIRGDYATATPFAVDEFNAAAQKLKPGQFTPEPVERTDRSDNKLLVWLYLESLQSESKSLADPDVQLNIVDRLNYSAQLAGEQAYIERLVRRATFSDLDQMVQELVNIAADRYWPPGP